MWRNAFSKINLTLEVLGRRPDGYHEVATVMQEIDLADDIVVEAADDIVFESDIDGVPPEQDLAFRAATLLRDIAKVSQGARIRVAKHVPTAAGLGGGSSDAACVLRGLNDLWRLGWSDSRLIQLAGQLGSDVPFFISGGTALAQGRGEVLSLLRGVPSQSFVLVCPPMRIDAKTSMLFKMLEPAMFTDGRKSQRLAETMGRGIPGREEDLVNVFEHVAENAFPALARYRDRFLKAGASIVHLSGAGPSLFALCPDEAWAKALHQSCKREGLHAFVVKGVSRLV